VHGTAFMLGLKKVQEISILELEGVTTSDFVVVLKPAGRGTHVELGAALAFNIPVFLLTPDECDYREKQNDTCAFYHHPLVTKAMTIGKLFREIEEHVKS